MTYDATTYLKQVPPHCKVPLLHVLLADVCLLDVLRPQCLAPRPEELQRREAGADVVVGLLAEGDERRRVRPQPLPPRNVAQPLRQPRAQRRREGELRE